MGDFDHAYRDAVDVRVALTSQLRQAEATDGSVPLMAPASGLGAGGGATPVGAAPSLPRRVVRGIYHAMKPLIRPFAVRARAYLIAPVMDVLNEIYLQSEATGRQLQALSEQSSRIQRDAVEAFRRDLSESAESMRRERGESLERMREEISELEQHVATLSAMTTSISQNAAEAAVFASAAARRVAVSVGSNEVLVRTEVGFVLCAATDHAVLASLLERGDPERGTRALIERLLTPGDVFVDVGAHIGMHTLAAARALKGHGKVIAIEPHAPTADLLRRSVAINGFAEIVAVTNAAAGATDGRGALFLGWISSHHSLYPLDAAEASGEDTEDVQIARLDTLLEDEPRVALIKIDVEGSELDVLAGARETIERNEDIALVVEFGREHIERAGRTVPEWLAAFEELGLAFRTINEETCALESTPVEDLMGPGSVNLFFARPTSSAWSRATAK